MIKLIIFDMDDTLYDEKSYVLSGFRQVAKYLLNKYRINSDEALSTLLNSFVNNGRGKNFDDIVKKYNLNQAVIKDLIKVYQGHTPQISLRSDISSFLRKLSKNFKLCLMTDGWVGVQRKKVRALGLEKYFDLIIYSQAEGIKYAKPHKKHFLHALEYFGVSSNESLTIGNDQEKDIAGSEKLGIKAILVNNLLDEAEKKKIQQVVKQR